MMALETPKDWFYVILGMLVFVAFAVGGVWAYNKLTWQPSFAPTTQNATEDSVVMTFVSGTEYKPGQQGQVIVELRDRFGAPLTGNATVASMSYAITPTSNSGLDNFYPLSYGCTKLQSKVDQTVTQLVVFGDGSSYGYPNKCAVFSGAGEVLTTGTVNASISYPYGWACVLSPNITIPQDEIFYGCMNGSGLHRTVWFYNLTNTSRFTTLGSATGNSFPFTETATQVQDITGIRSSAVQPACTATVWYPNKTRLIDEQSMRQSDFSGNAFINFTVPSIDGVYEYQASCYAKNKWNILSHSFHVTQQRIKAVVVK